MIVTCPRCFATYNVPDAALASGPRQMRCSDCKFEWTETPLPQEAIAALAPEPQPQPEPQPEPSAPVDTFAQELEALQDMKSSLASSPDVESVAASFAPSPVEAPVEEAPISTPRRTPAPTKKAERKMGSNTVAAVVLVLAVAVSALVLARQPLGKASPLFADLYEMAGLPVEGPADWFSFEGVKLEKSEVDGKLVFALHGNLKNQSRHPRPVPALYVYWRSKEGDLGPMKTIVPGFAALQPGQQMVFSESLVGVDASVGGEVKITFTPPEDASPKPAADKSHPVPAPAHQPAHEAAPATPATHEPVSHEPVSHEPAPENGTSHSPAPKIEAEPAPAPVHPVAPDHPAPAHEEPQNEPAPHH